MFKLVFFSILFLSSVNAISMQCSVAEVKNILEGCEKLTGLNITSVGGTIVNEHNCDVLLPKQVFIEEPLFQYPLADSKKFYSLLMVDLDAPPQLEGEFFLHMLKSNINGLALKSKEGLQNMKTSGIDYRGYKGPMPPRGTGPHRYITLLFEQADGNNFLPNVPQSRNRFVLTNWLRGKNLCGPIAGIQFRSQF
ncbi:phosphatidylethanolamine-binding protein 1 [Amyelois transitella]|uniref:phosphatidylethanolamine-binding protein 1 n=1 Tax=Amyelois transitella TaxID=680683 RepID=UPI00067E17FE|nr:phosphatidylethanolamine-binding protein 1 [Amyelois transitella]